MPALSPLGAGRGWCFRLPLGLELVDIMRSDAAVWPRTDETCCVSVNFLFPYLYVYFVSLLVCCVLRLQVGCLPRTLRRSRQNACSPGLGDYLVHHLSFFMSSAMLVFLLLSCPYPRLLGANPVRWMTAEQWANASAGQGPALTHGFVAMGTARDGP